MACVIWAVKVFSIPAAKFHISYIQSEAEIGNNPLGKYNSLSYHFAARIRRHLHTIAACTGSTANKPVLICGCPAPIADIPLVFGRIFIIWTSSNHAETLIPVIYTRNSKISHLFECCYLALGNVINIEAAFVNESSLRPSVANLWNTNKTAILVLEKQDRSPC